MPLPETELAVRERDLLRARAEEEAEHALTLALVLWNEPLEQLLQVAEEPALALLHAHEPDVVEGRHVRDPALEAGISQLPPHLVRDVEHRQRRQRRRDRIRDLDRSHLAATSRGKRKLTFSRATSTSSSSS